MGEYLNLNEVGSLTQSGKHAGGNAQDTVSLAKTHQTNMEGLQQAGLKGMSGTTFQRVSATNVGSTALLGRQFADQAVRWVKAEKHAINGDQDADQQQQPATSAAEASLQAINKPINV